MIAVKQLSLLALTLAVSLATPDTTYGQSKQCTVAITDAKAYAKELSSRTSLLVRCATKKEADALRKRTQKLQSCASDFDPKNDCSSDFRRVQYSYAEARVCYSEYRRVKNSFSDYRNSMEELTSYCE